VTQGGKETEKNPTLELKKMGQKKEDLQGKGPWARNRRRKKLLGVLLLGCELGKKRTEIKTEYLGRLMEKKKGLTGVKLCFVNGFVEQQVEEGKTTKKESA